MTKAKALKEPPTYETHPELHHYTGWDGLFGIINKGELWATHFRHLNDASEIIHFRDHLTNELSVKLKAFLKGWSARTVEHNRRLLFRGGGAETVGALEAKRFVDAFYEVTFGPREADVVFSNPYLASFCSHEADHEYERANGLLSQWRGYGARGGYAIVFDTQKLSDLIRIEADKYEYSTLSLSVVVYNDGSNVIKELFAELLDRLTAEYGANMEFGKAADVDVYNPLVGAASRFKHRGFMEEREVRIIASPMTAELRNKLSLDPSFDKTAVLKPLKPILGRGTDSAIPYIELFDQIDGKKLPIKRIIVGPSRDQKERQRRVRKFLSSFPLYRRVPVYLSETPFTETRN